MASHQGGFDYYKALEVDERADETTIKKAYRKLVLKWHPDKHPVGRDEAEEKIRLINAAYEILSNPTKKDGYDQQRRAQMNFKRGMAVPTTAMSVSPRMRIPKEFMMQAMGYPEKFLRVAGPRAFVHTRKDVKAEFASFFGDCKFSLWWLPEVNNMCRIRVLGSRGYGEQLAADTGVAGGLNLCFELGGLNRKSESEVTLMAASKGALTERVNFIAVTSPAYENAFRFEAAQFKNCYLTFMPPMQLRVMPFEGEGHPGVIDWVLVDYSVMYKFIEIEEVLLPTVMQLGDWVSLSAIRSDKNVTAYFQNILGRPVWDEEDFLTYFEGHWTQWEYNPDSQCVRARSPAEKLGHQLESCRTTADVASAIAGAGEELQALPLQAAMRALKILAEHSTTPAAGESLDVMAAVNRAAAFKRILSGMKGICASARKAENTSFGLGILLAFVDIICALGNDSASPEIRTAAIESVTEEILSQLSLGQNAPPAFKVNLDDLARILKLPSVHKEAKGLADIFAPVVVGLDSFVLLQVSREATAVNCIALAVVIAGELLTRLSSLSREEMVATLQVLADAGERLEEVTELVRAHAMAVDPADLAALVTSLAERGVSSQALVESIQVLASRDCLASLPADRLLGLAVAATKSPALSSTFVGAVACAAAAAAFKFTSADLMRLLLAAAKAKGGAIPEDAKVALVQGVASVLMPQLSTLGSNELVKLVLAVACYGASPFMEASGKEVSNRLSDFLPAHLILLTQGLTQGLGASHPTVKGLFDYWSELLSDGQGRRGKESNGADDAVNSRRRELERSRSLTGDQLVKLLQILSPSFDNGSSDKRSGKLLEAIGSQLLTSAKSLTPANLSTLEVQLADRNKGIGRFSGRKELLDVIEDAQRGESRSRSKEPATKKRHRRTAWSKSQ